MSEPTIPPALSATDAAIRQLSEQIIEHIEHESEKGFVVLMSALDGPPSRITLASAYGVTPDPAPSLVPPSDPQP